MLARPCHVKSFFLQRQLHSRIFRQKSSQTADDCAVNRLQSVEKMLLSMLLLLLLLQLWLAEAKAAPQHNCRMLQLWNLKGARFGTRWKVWGNVGFVASWTCLYKFESGLVLFVCEVLFAGGGIQKQRVPAGGIETAIGWAFRIYGAPSYCF